MTAYFLTRKAEGIAESLKISKVLRDAPTALELHPNLNPQGGFSNSGNRGFGLSLLLIDQIATESYVKELLGLYRDSEQGKLIDLPYHAPMVGILGIHYNETGVYSGTAIPRSYLPIKNGAIVWNQAYQGMPAEAMTLRGFNTTVANSLGIGTQYNDMSSTGKYVNALQIDKSYFSDQYFKSNLNGYKATSSRKNDMFFLPDSVTYLDTQFSSMMKGYNMDGEIDSSHLAMMSISHNAGTGYFQSTNTFGVLSGSGTSPYIKGKNSDTLSEYTKYSQQLSKDFYAASKKYTTEQMLSLTKDEAPGAGVILLMDAGYYLSPKAYAAFSTGLQRSDGTYVRNKAFISAWKKLKGETLTEAQSYAKLKEYQKSVEQAYPGYATASQISNVYGDRHLGDPKGGIFKLETDTSSVYKNKVNGKDPRVMHIVNAEVAGHMFSSITGDFVYASLLKLSGVDVDMTNPDQYYEQPAKDGEFIPKGGEFSVILNKIGVNLSKVDPKAMDMLEIAYKVSGQYYSWGGKAYEINQKNWGTIGWAYGGNTERLASRKQNIYRTKDGSDPSVLENRRNTNLVNYKGLVFDCSGLIQYAYNNSKAKGSKSLPGSSKEQYYDKTSLTTIKWDDARPGDVLSRDGHIAFFLAWGNEASLSTTEAKSEKPHKGRKGTIWTLEASSTGQMTGIRAQTWIKPSAGFVARRFNTLK